MQSPTSDTPDLIRAAQHTLAQMYQSRYIYKKADVIALDLVDEYQEQLSIVPSWPSRDVQKRIMQEVDAINKKWGRRMVVFAAQKIQQPWRMSQAHKSPTFTTSWHELPLISIS